VYMGAYFFAGVIAEAAWDVSLYLRPNDLVEQRRASTPLKARIRFARRLLQRVVRAR